MRFPAPITAAAAATIAIVLIGEAAFIASSEPLTGIPIFQPTQDDATVVVKRRLMARAPGRVVMVGDSSCMMGLSPPLLEAAGFEAVNLCTFVSFTVPGFAALAEETMRAHRPRALVVAMLPRTLEVSEAEAREFDLFGRYLVAYGMQSPTYAIHFLDKWLWFARKHQMNRFPPSVGGPFTAFASRLEGQAGHAHEGSRYTGGNPREFKDVFEPTPYSRGGLVHLAQTAALHDLRLVFWWSPSPNDAVSPQYLADAHRFVTETLAPFPGVVIPRPPPVWDTDQFGTVTHVTPAAAERLSAELAAALAAAL